MKAITAIARNLLIVVWHVLTEQEADRNTTAAVTERQACAPAKARLEIGKRGHEQGRSELYKAIVADQMGKLSAQILLDIFDVKCLEGAKTHRKKVYPEGHDLAGPQPATASPLLGAEKPQTCRDYCLHKTI